MNAAFYRQAPEATGPARAGKQARARRIHRWIATLFTLSVAANFAVMLWGQPPAWITYAPLPPLLVLLVTGLIMLVAPWFGNASKPKAGETR